MAEIQTNHSTNPKGPSQKKRLSTKVDLTPMVDLGFLLITFFIFTTSLASPTALKLVMPDDKPSARPLEVSRERIITIIVSKNNQLFYYTGVFTGVLNKTSFIDLRSVLIQKKKSLLGKYGSSNLTCLIKVTDEANYKGIVDCLDEMVINNISTYMLLEPERNELIALKG